MKEVIKYLKNILKDNDTVVIGLSGGPDSMCLLDILKKLDVKLNIICAHINHNIRKESNDELDFITKYCHQNNLTIETTKFSKKSPTKNYSEAELREKRYIYFKEIIDKYNAKYLFTAHHGDDLVETILMRLTRGSNLKGYSGFEMSTKKDNYIIVKPLIYLTKEEIIKYNEDNSIPYKIDKTNESSKYTRNRYRNEILPFLKKENQKVHLKYLKFSQEINNYYNFVDKIVTKELQKSFKNNILNLDYFNKLDELIQRKLIEKILDANYDNNLYLITDKHLNSILKIIKSKKPNLSLDLPENLIIKKSYNKLFITREKQNDNYNYKYELNKDIKLPNNHEIKLVKECDLTNNNCIRLNSSEIKLPLYVRTKKDGDRMLIKNMKNYKKIKDIFIDLKLTADQRKIQPIVIDSENNIIWLPGLKKSQFDKAKDEFYDIILWYS